MNFQRHSSARQRIVVSVTISLLCLAFQASSSQKTLLDLPNCWTLDRTQYKNGSYGTLVPNILDKEHCQELCINTEDCLGVAWNERSNCLFIMPNSSGPALDSSWHTVLRLTTNCTEANDSYTSLYAWKEVRDKTEVSGGVYQDGFTSETYCKLRCARNRTCSGVVWDNKAKDNRYCYLLFGNHTVKNHSSARYWDLSRHSIDTKLNTSQGCPAACSEPLVRTPSISTTVEKTTAPSTTAVTKELNIQATSENSTMDSEFATTDNVQIQLSAVIIIAMGVMLCVSVFFNIGVSIYASRLRPKKVNKTEGNIHSNDIMKSALLRELKKKSMKHKPRKSNILKSSRRSSAKKTEKIAVIGYNRPVKKPEMNAFKKVSMKTSPKKSVVETSLSNESNPAKVTQKNLKIKSDGKSTKPNLYEDSHEVPCTKECAIEKSTADEYYTGLDIVMRESVDVKEDEVYTAIEKMENVDEPIHDDDEIYQNEFQ